MEEDRYSKSIALLIDEALSSTNEYPRPDFGIRTFGYAELPKLHSLETTHF